MDENIQGYLKMRPYRRHGPQQLLAIMGHRFADGFKNPWQQFGYEIGGPLCFAFTKWIADEVERSHPEISDIAFIARDGYLLKQIYDMLPHVREVGTHYVYAPRALKKRCEDSAEHERYRAYLRSCGFGSGTIASVDTVTMEFSGQRLIASSIEQPVFGLCWVVLGYDERFQSGLSFTTYQSERYHVISNWNVVEFIMTSPEPPVQSLSNGKPVYFLPDSFEAQREAIFVEISKGVLEFARDACAADIPAYAAKEMVSWINGYLRHPNKGDRALFEGVMFSESADHSDSIPLNPFTPMGAGGFKDRLWLYSQRHPALYKALRKGKIVWKKIYNEVK